MLKWKYIFLILGLIEMAVGFSDARPNAFFYLGRPIGTVLLGLFLITLAFEKEWALYDEQNRSAHPEQKPAEKKQRPLSPEREESHHPGFTAAHSH